MRYAIDVELRTQKFISDTSANPNVRVTEVYLQDINTTEGATHMLSELGLTAASSINDRVGVPFPVPKVFKTPAEVRK